ncbi:MAG: hypothetical protein ACI8W3_002229 [Myxococcota bacterium]
MYLRLGPKVSSTLITMVLLTVTVVQGCRSIRESEMPPRPLELSASASPLPAPGHYRLGSHASAEEIARLDIDIMPDGSGLPVGEGSVVSGRLLFAETCQHCHGPSGSGGQFDQLVGRIEGDTFPFAEEPSRKRTIGNYWPYATTLFDYIRRAMPLERPGSLSDDEVYALTAYLLFENKIIGESTSLNHTTLPAIRMPARDRFIRDDHSGGREFR